MSEATARKGMGNVSKSSGAFRASERRKRSIRLPVMMPMGSLTPCSRSKSMLER